jgi:hypothetical protein
MRATCPAHLILIDFICITILGDKHKYEAPHCATFSCYENTRMERCREQTEIKEKGAGNNERKVIKMNEH